MNDPRLGDTLALLATAHPNGARVLELYGLDYCCRGTRTLASACADAGIEPEVVLDALDHVRGPARDGVDWTDLAPTLLVDHLEAVHHAYLKAEFPRLSALAERVGGVHGSRHPELVAIGATYEELRADLEPHLVKEEQVLFPMVRTLDEARSAGDPPPAFHCGTVRNPVSVMMIEHDRAGLLLERLRELTDDYQAPADGCASYRALFEGLAQLEADTHLHVHKENNLLFPAVVELEAQLVAT